MSSIISSQPKPSKSSLFPPFSHIARTRNMEDQCSPLSWSYFYYDEGLEELKLSLLQTTMELQSTILSAQEEIATKDDELVHLRSLLNQITRERDEAHAKCQALVLEKLLLHQQLLQQQQQQPHPVDVAPSSGTTSTEENDSPRKIDSKVMQYPSSDCDENFVVSPGKESLAEVTDRIVLRKPFPEKGEFLQAVMEAGPLLQTLLLAGPLPQWQHQPPQLKTVDIPPVTISSSPTITPRLVHQDSSLSTSNGSGSFSKKRAAVNCGPAADRGCSDSSSIYNRNKTQRVVNQSLSTNNI